MNPFPIVWSLFTRNRVTLVMFVVLISFSIGLGVAVTMQERALRQGSARAADKFDLVIGAPGNPFDLVLATVYARPAAMGLVPGDTLVELMAHPEVELAAPIAFGDSMMGFPMMGTTTAFVQRLSPGMDEGRMFAAHAEVILGAAVPLEIGQHYRAAHGGFDAAEKLHEHELVVVGRMQRTHSAWDNVVVVPVEQVWETHGLGGVEHEQEDETIGGPYLAGETPAVPAIVVIPKTVSAAYGLRSAYRTNETQAVFPAEILVQLYALLGDARSVMSILALATQVLVVAAVLSGIVVILQLFSHRFAVLRALGATRGYVFAVAWTYVVLLILSGAVCGVVLGGALAWGISTYLSAQTGVTMPVSLSWQEVQFVVVLVGVGALLAALPAAAVYRRSVASALA